MIETQTIMKQLTLSAITMLLFTVANAQFTIGEKYLSGAIAGHLADLDLNDNDGVESYSIHFSPAIHTFRSDKKAFGIKALLGYQYGKSSTPTAVTKHRQGTIGAGLFWQNYINLNKGFYLVMEKGFNGAFISGSDDVISGPVSDADITAYNINLYLTPGIGYKLTNRLIVGLNLNNILAIGYTHSVNKTATSKSKSDALSVFSGLNNTNLGSVGINFGWKLK